MHEISGKKVVVVGSGGNIGSHLIPHLGRMPEVGHVTLVDYDVYEHKNLQTQDIVPADIGKPKALVQAQRLRRINPHIEVRAIPEPVENIPLGHLRCDVILAGLDSKRARQVVNQNAWRLGVIWIDSGVDAEMLLARINVYVPGLNNPCYECGFDARDYETIEQSYSCSGVPLAPPETNAPSSLGCLAASILATECRKLLTGEHHRVAAGKQLLMENMHHNYYLTRMTYNSNCRLPEHHTAPINGIETLPDDVTLGALFESGLHREQNKKSTEKTSSLQVVGQPFVNRLTCRRCGNKRSLLRLRVSLRAASYKCSRCGSTMVAGGFDTIDRLELSALPQRTLGRPLKSIGVRRGDILRISAPDDETRYVEIAGGHN